MVMPVDLLKSIFLATGTKVAFSEIVLKNRQPVMLHTNSNALHAEDIVDILLYIYFE